MPLLRSLGDVGDDCFYRHVAPNGAWLDWPVARGPDDVGQGRGDVLGPGDRKVVSHDLNSIANCFMSDCEDAHCPTSAGTLDGQINVHDAVRGTIEFTSPECKRYKLND